MIEVLNFQASNFGVEESQILVNCIPEDTVVPLLRGINIRGGRAK